jgi:hypothetical protein
MKSPVACRARRFCDNAVFDEDGSSNAASSSETRFATYYCHCLSSDHNAFEDVDGASSPLLTPMACDLCERLRGQTDGHFDLVDAIRTEDSRVADRPSRRRRDENSSLTSDSKASGEKRDRTSRCDRVPLDESSARCASSVVRWKLASRLQAKSTEWRRLVWIVFLLSIASIVHLAAAETRKNTVESVSKDGGKCVRLFIQTRRRSIRIFP